MPGGQDDMGHPKNDCMIVQNTSNASHGINCHHHMCETNCILMSINGNLEQLLIECMICSVHISSLQHMDKLQSKMWHSQFKPKHIALGTAKNFLNVMTQKCVRHAVKIKSEQYDRRLAKGSGGKDRKGYK